DWKINHPLIEMHGNNGSIDDDPAAAMRYTEARLSSFTDALLEDIDNDTVEWVFNFDDTLKEPTVLPSEVPLLLVNGSTGIAAGYATNIPPHNLGELIDAIIYLISNPKADTKELMNFVKGPDFPTGGIVQGKDALYTAYDTGKGRIVLRSRVSIDKHSLIITEIPYEVIKSNLVKRIDEIRINRDIDGILEVRDESDRNGLRVVIDLKKDADPELILKYLYKNSELQISYNYNMIAIVDSRPVLLSLNKALTCFLDFKKQVVYRRSVFLKEKKENRLHILEGLIKAISILDEVIDIIRHSKDKADSKQKLIEAFGFSDAQAEAIVNLRLYRLSNTDITELRQEYQQLIKEIAELKRIIDNPQILILTVIDELKKVKEKYQKNRLTTIEDEVEDISLSKEEMITDEEVVVVISRDGYLKKVSMRSYQASDNSLGGFKENDVILGSIRCHTLSNLLLFLSNGNYINLPVYELEDAKWKDIGKHFSQMVSGSSDAKIVDAVVVDDYNTYAYILMASAKGMVKKTMINEFKVSRYNRLYTAMKLKADDSLISAKVAYTGDKCILISKEGFCSYYSSDLINPSSPKAAGSKGMNLGKGDQLVSMGIKNDDNSVLLLKSDNGQFKKIDNQKLTLTNRPVKGYRLTKVVKSNPIRLDEAIVANNNESLSVYDGELKYLEVKSLPFKDLEQSMSKVNELNAELWVMGKIQSVAHIDIPDNLLVTAVPEPVAEEEGPETEMVLDSVDEMVEDEPESVEEAQESEPVEEAEEEIDENPFFDDEPKDDDEKEGSGQYVQLDIFD
ncbi:MAG: DNA gyrase subunit A, partial [Erysipelotrichaceae bacterium]|nr:DNA gyrase subunit A [Erysipelotrichaceae bacterium]